MHNYASECQDITELSRVVVKAYSELGKYLTPLVTSPEGTFPASPSFLYLHASQIVVSFDSMIGFTAATQLTEVHFHPGLPLLQPSSAFKEKILDINDELQAALVCQAETLVRASRSRKHQRTMTTVGRVMEDVSDVEANIDGDDEELRPAKYKRLSDD
jgi:hypothetical protein